MIENSPGITRLLDRLEAKGLVRRERCPVDRRQVLCHASAGALALLTRARAPDGRSHGARLRTARRAAHERAHPRCSTRCGRASRPSRARTPQKSRRNHEESRNRRPADEPAFRRPRRRRPGSLPRPRGGHVQLRQVPHDRAVPGPPHRHERDRASSRISTARFRSTRPTRPRRRWTSRSRPRASTRTSRSATSTCARPTSSTSRTTRRSRSRARP